MDMHPGIPLLCAAFTLSSPGALRAAENVMIADVPDYSWHTGCFGTASGNLMGFWDRNGFPDFYTGPTAGGVAPLDSRGENAGIRSLWASRAGFDGRPADKPGHIDDYWTYFENDASYSYESAQPDPITISGLPEHEPDCLGDFIGASQNKWTDMDGECSGNIDAFAFNFWDKTGARRINFTPPPQGSFPVRDIQSGWRGWTEYRGYQADVFSQLADFNPNVPVGNGFTFDDLKAEIDAGYPVMLFLQPHDQFERALLGLSNANPRVHGMLAYGYVIEDDGTAAVRYRTSWGSGDQSYSIWGPQQWEAALPLRGVVGYRPLPMLREVAPTTEGLRIRWDGPSATIVNNLSGASFPAHWYVLEHSETLGEPFVAVGEPTSELETMIASQYGDSGFFRVRLMTPEEAGQPRE